MARKRVIIVAFGGLLLTICYINLPQNIRQNSEKHQGALAETEPTTEKLIPVYNNDSVHNTVGKYTFKDLDMRLCSKESKSPIPILRLPCPKTGIVTMIPGGRTGNQMWEYSVVWIVAKKTGLQPFIPTCIKITLDNIFAEMSLPALQAIGHCDFDLKTSVDSIEQLVSSKQSIIVPAFSFKRELAVPHMAEIVEEFKFKNPLRHKAQQDLIGIAASSLHPKPHTFIGVHVRRTDYGSYLKWKRNATLVSTTFFHKAMDFYRSNFSNCLFIYISDDPKWCFNQFGNLSDVFVSSLTTRNSAAEDLALMAACNHTIFDYGTFGEWGAILAGGYAVFNNKDQNINAYLESWIIMD